MARRPEGIRIAILATDGVERVELEQPRGELYGAGATSDLDRQVADVDATSTTRCSCPGAR